MSIEILEKPTKIAYNRPKLTPKQQKFISSYIKYGNATQAAMESYNCSSADSAGKIGSALLGKVEIESRIAGICQRRGLTEDWAVKILKKQGKATRPVIIGKEVQEYPDNAARLQASETALKLHGHLKTGVSVTTDNRSVTMVLSAPEDITKLDEILARLEKLQDTKEIEHQTGEVIDIPKIRAD